MRKISVLIVTAAVCLAYGFNAPCVFAEGGQKISPERALELLKEGNARFVDGCSMHPNQSSERREETAINGQRPFAIVLACSDSRVPVETIFDAGIGDIFVVRDAGNVSQGSIIAGSIEYAAEHLNTPLLVIMGHTGCGAVKAALSGGSVEGNIRTIKQIIEPAANQARNNNPSLQGNGLLNAAIKANVLRSKADLLAGSHIVKDMSEDGNLEIVTAVYNINTGTIDWEF